MPTVTFSIPSGGSHFDFTLEIDGSGELVSINAEKNGNPYDCSLQVESADKNLGIECCRPPRCQSGQCVPLARAKTVEQLSNPEQRATNKKGY